jgi:hypothetical protein
MKWLIPRWLRFAHKHHYEVVECAEYVHVNKFTGAKERFPAVWMRCVCGHQKAQAIVSSATVTVRIPIKLKMWEQVTIGIRKVEHAPHAPRAAARLKTAPPPRLAVGSVAKVVWAARGGSTGG